MSRVHQYLFFLLPLMMISPHTSAQEDYKLWLQYAKVQDSKLATEYKFKINGIVALSNSETIQVASKELQLGLLGMLDTKIDIKQIIDNENVLIFGSKTSLNDDILKYLKNELDQINDEGYIIKTISIVFSFATKSPIIAFAKKRMPYRSITPL